MKHPRLDTWRGKEQQRRNIERSKMRLELTSIQARKEFDLVVRGSKDFTFVCFGDVTELPLWKRP